MDGDENRGGPPPVRYQDICYDGKAKAYRTTSNDNASQQQSNPGVCPRLFLYVLRDPTLIAISTTHPSSLSDPKGAGHIQRTRTSTTSFYGKFPFLFLSFSWFSQMGPFMCCRLLLKMLLFSAAGWLGWFSGRRAIVAASAAWQNDNFIPWIM